MTVSTANGAAAFLEHIANQNPHQPEYIQAVTEFVHSIWDYYQSRKELVEEKILDRICEPDRIIKFKVVWENDKGEVQVNKAYRVQHTNLLGPYKGGLRFHPSVNESILKFLAFEQIFKNSLTTLPMGAGKGGSNFDPKGKSDREVMRFCQAFMTELQKYIDKDIDVPAGDIGVGGREIGFLTGQYRKLKNQYSGVLTGKGMSFGGSQIRPEATGYGSVYFANEMLKNIGQDMAGKKCVVSGSGNVAQYTVEKLLQLGASVHTVSDSSGFVFDKDGLNQEKLEYLKDLKNNRRGRIKEMADEYSLEYHEGKKPWNVFCDAAFPSATQNEINKEDAQNLISNGCKLVSEGANMPSNLEAIDVFLGHKILFGPGKAANAGGVGVSGLEMSQNSLRYNWTREEVDSRLKGIMNSIHDQCKAYGSEGNFVNYVKGSNIAGFARVAESALAQGL